MTVAVIPIIAAGIHRENPVTVRLLALCPMLAVSVSVAAAAVLGLLTLVVMAMAGAAVSVIRRHVPYAVRLPIFLMIVAAMVALVDLSLAAYRPDIHRQLGIFLPLITTNCAVLARLEVFASKQPPAAAFVDGAACGVGLLLAIVALAAMREFVGTGGVAPFFMIDGWPAVPAALSPAGGFFLFALMIVCMRRAGLAAA